MSPIPTTIDEYGTPPEAALVGSEDSSLGGPGRKGHWEAPQKSTKAAETMTHVVTHIGENW
jgi:hypothetical protein